MSFPEGFDPELIDRARHINTLVLDVDGVLTDGRIIYAEHGDELKFFDVQDGAGLVYWNRMGGKTAIISGRKTKLLKRRAKEMRIDFLCQGQLRKADAFDQMLRKLRVQEEHVCVVGDDLLDLPMLRRAGLAIAVPNAVTEVRRAVDYVTHRSGGRGAVREVVEILLSASGRWADVLTLCGLPPSPASVSSEPAS